MKILFVGETWEGSSARSLREALVELPGVDIDDIGEDQSISKGSSLVVRGANRLLLPWYAAELERRISARVTVLRPDVLMVYKGAMVAAGTVRRARTSGLYTVNVFPDCSPHAHGARLKAAVGEYDLVVSTKPFHPSGWSSTYGYGNRCVFVPHGYDPAVHYWSNPPDPVTQIFDVVLVAGWRPQYEELLLQLAAQLMHQPIRFCVAGPGWPIRAPAFPPSWQFAGPVRGRAYGEFVRRGKIVIAPVQREVIIRGVQQPGDEDTTRSYELAAASCFFLHRRTPYIETVYDENTEVPMWDDAEELAAQILRFLPLEANRSEMAARAHGRAVPAYSMPVRANEIVRIVGATRGRDVPCPAGS